MNITSSNVLETIALALTAVLTIGCTGHPASRADAADGEGATFVGSVYDDSGNLREPATLPTVEKTEAEWKAQLTPDEYRILRDHGTERAFTGALLENHATGVYRCAACNLPLFSSDAKFESGTGWPSFFRSIADGNVGESRDASYGMVRTEIHCARCGGHLGHVFPDGPAPTGQRYCVNSLSIAFTPIEDVAKLAEPVPDMKKAGTADGPTASAVFAGGCFWCVEAVFEELDGVKEAISGYAGGTAETADYKTVCTGRTGHAEAVKIIYDPSKISYVDLLRVHFATHDPTTLNRQGADMGTQYRSAIFYANDEEKALAKAFIDDLTDQKVYDRPIVTTLEPLTGFYPAEQYHQNFVCLNPTQGYVRSVALPKVEKVRKKFKDRLKAESPLERAGRN